MSAWAAILLVGSVCGDPEYRRFDFWIGDWAVSVGGKAAGENHVEAVVGGCALVERFAGEKGWSGTSLNRWDGKAKKWRQSWVDTKGNVLELVGDLEGKQMKFTGGTAERPQRVTYFDLGKQALRQLHEISEDGGKSWKVVFDGQYTRK